jgi:hypothetical protein
VHRGLVVAAAVAFVALGAPARADWKADSIADAVKAAPPSVTKTAKIYGFDKSGKLTLLRDGAGPYSCVGSGAYSIRLGKPPLPYPDPLCADQNAWAFLQASWAEANPLKPSKPLPTTPGLVWMLAGMNVTSSGVQVGQNASATVTDHDQDHNKMHGGGPGTIAMAPHLMILPLPLDSSAAKLPGAYDPANPTQMWVMAPNTAIEHLHVHFTESVVKALMDAHGKK